MIFEKEREGVTMLALDAFDSFLFSLSRALHSPFGVFVQIQVCFFFFFNPSAVTVFMGILVILIIG